MIKNVIGILGGMGPEATNLLYSRIISHTSADNDQEHLPVAIWANPAIPPRTDAISGLGPSPLPLLVDGAKRLKQIGADFLIIPCVTAHYFVDDIENEGGLPVLPVYRAVYDEIKRLCPDVRKVGLLSTPGTLAGGFFQNYFRKFGIEIIPGPGQFVLELAAEVKSKRPIKSRQDMATDLHRATYDLFEKGAQAVIAGCTELPLLEIPNNLPGPYIDCLSALAKAAIRRAGNIPV